MNLERIKTLAEYKRIPFKKLASEIGMSEGNLHRCVRENKIQASDLEKIAKALKVPIENFFEEDNNKSINQATGGDFNASTAKGNASATVGDNTLVLQIDLLKSLLAEKDERIKDLKDRIEELKKK